MSEAEALAVRFTIDHYEPVWFRKDLECVYSNLMYACGECNLRKLDLNPPEAARASGNRFFRPDEDSYLDHFEITNANGLIFLQGKTAVGKFTVEYLDLNRQALIRLRGIREQLTECRQFVAHGVTVLRGFDIDRLPTHIKGKASVAIQRNIQMIEEMENQIDQVLSASAKSDLADPDPGVLARAQQRGKKLDKLKVTFPGSWRAPRESKRRKSGA